eukprot:m.109654 g.109654  ORF g.109654 m.109654 type:complete len:309 (+) comp9205_c0_seq1:121-1047(+)
MLEIELNDGSKHPMVGFGTYKVGFIPPSSSSTSVEDNNRSPMEIIKDAVDVGYRYFDCAEFYGNEKEIGEALHACNVSREELYLVSKAWTTTIYNGAEAVKAQVEQSLKDLQTEYLDLFLIHWPVPGKHIEAYLALEELVSAGKIRGIGLSNYTIEDYEELKPHISMKPLVNQMEINPFLFRKNTIQYFQAEGIQLEAYRALRQAKEMENDVIATIAKKHDKHSSQILTRWCIQHNIIVLAKSSKKERMEENFNADGFQLDEEDMTALDGLTTDANIAVYVDLYKKCVVRDTPLQSSGEGIKDTITTN